MADGEEEEEEDVTMMTTTTTTKATLMDDGEDGGGETESGELSRRSRYEADDEEEESFSGLPNERPNGQLSIGNVYRRSRLLKDSLVDYFERTNDTHADERLVWVLFLFSLFFWRLISSACVLA